MTMVMIVGNSPLFETRRVSLYMDGDQPSPLTHVLLNGSGSCLCMSFVHFVRTLTERSRHIKDLLTSNHMH